MKTPLIVITGPTGVGKTDISLRLAERVGGEIVSCDSMQVYRLMDIGSAKATKEERERVPHHLIDILDPEETFTVSDFKRLAEEAIADISGRGRIPILVGGTGLYIDSVIMDMTFTEGGNDPEYRVQLSRLAGTMGNESVHALLREVDSVSAERIHPNNLKRVIRALEVYRQTGRPFSTFRDEDTFNPAYDVRYYFLNRNREKLYEDIDRRVIRMMEAGLVDEVRMLKDRGLTRAHQSMQGIGYKEVLACLEGEVTLEEAVEMVQRFSRNYAKRQLTWFRRKPFAIELSKDDLTDEQILNIVQSHGKVPADDI
jgi:tRNA dimethylallyltransferase